MTKKLSFGFYPAMSRQNAFQHRTPVVLLFHHNPEKWISGAYVKIGYFESDSELRYQDEIHGSLISQADRVVDLMGKHRSRPYNPLVANTFFRAGFIESWGRGIQKIKDSCAEAGKPLPEYTVKSEDIMVMFKSLGKIPQGSPQAQGKTIRERILAVQGIQESWNRYGIDENDAE